MKEKSLPFSPPMARATWLGLKTETRRICKVNPARVQEIKREGNEWVFKGDIPTNYDGEVQMNDWSVRVKSPYAIGQHLWVREAWRVGKGYDELPGSQFTVPSLNCVHYEADGAPYPHIEWGRYRHARFMPRWASRMTLMITDVRVERVQDISKEDALAEGLTCLSKDGGRTYKYGIPDRDGLPGNDDLGWHWNLWEVDPRRAYETLWDQLNGEGPYSWTENPFVWVITYQCGLRADQ
jgi:hypothetical protein